MRHEVVRSARGLVLESVLVASLDYEVPGNFSPDRSRKNILYKRRRLGVDWPVAGRLRPLGIHENVILTHVTVENTPLL